MGTQAQAAQLQQAPQAPHWSLATRIAFRFCFVYFGLFCLLTQISGGLLPLPNIDISDPATLSPMRQVVTWTATHIFKVTHPLVIDMSGSGDKIFDWVLAFCLLVIAAGGYDRLVDTRPQTAELRHAAQMVSPLPSLCSCRTDVRLRHGESHPSANAFPISYQTAGAIRQFLAHGRSLGLRRGVAGL